jgi:hypothetical protein
VTGEPTQNGRFFDPDGKPNYAEHANSALMRAHSAPVREEAAKWLRSAEVNAQLAALEATQDLARSNRELAAAMNRLADIREGVVHE